MNTARLVVSGDLRATTRSRPTGKKGGGMAKSNRPFMEAILSRPCAAVPVGGAFQTLVS